MAKPWAAVASDPAYQSLPPDQQEAARQQYFSDVVAPQVPPEKLDYVRQQFDTNTKPKTGDVNGFGLPESKVVRALLDPAYFVGDKTSELATKAGLSPNVAAGLGYAANVATNVLPTMGVAKAVGKAVAPTMRRGAEWLMQSSIKPTPTQLATGEGKRAVAAMLDNGINATSGGMTKLEGKIDDLNSQISGKIAGSNARVNVADVKAPVNQTMSFYETQANPQQDMSNVQKTWDNFANHPYLQDIERQGVPLNATLNQVTQGKIQALQAAGKLKTFSAQQGELAHGRGPRLSPMQTENQPYFNVGATGGETMSPSAYPVPGYPRIPGRYTQNIDRVPEGEQGYQDAMAAYMQRRADEQAAQKAVDAWDASRGSLPVQKAQQIKQGTYKILNDKYDKQGVDSATDATEKAIARGLKDQIAAAVPDVAPLNAAESELINAKNVAMRQVLLNGNKNPLGLAPLSPTAKSMAMFLLDRSAAGKSVAARALNAGKERVPQSLAALIMGATEALSQEQQRRKGESQ